jgi:hypothetical protein
MFSDYQNNGVTQPHPPWLILSDHPVDANGVLTVSIDFSGLTELDPTPARLCKPNSFCKVQGDTCVTALNKDGGNSPAVQADKSLWAEADYVCRNWAVKDLDCPEKGCLGFAFTMPAGFGASGQGQGARPDPQPFPSKGSTGKPDWLTRFQRTATPPDSAAPKSDASSSCYYSELPVAPGSCKAP